MNVRGAMAGIPRVFYLAAAVGIITIVAYLPALHNDFVDWDDNIYVFENQHIQSLDAAFFQWAFTNLDVSNWHPLTWISHAIDFAIWGLNPMGHHLSSILFHGVNAFIVVLLIARLMKNSSSGAKTTEAGLQDERAILITAGVTGLLFGLHPLHVESAAWVAERKDLLCALFFMLSLMSYAGYATGPACAASGNRIRVFVSDRRYVLALVFFLLAFFSKPMAVSLPVVLVLLDWYPLGRVRSLRSLTVVVAEKLPFIALSLGMSILTLLAQKKVLTPEYSVTVSERILVAAFALINYLWKMLWPTELIPFYEYPYPEQVSVLSFEYGLPLVLVAALCTVVIIIAARGNKLWALMWGYYCITLLPVLGLVQVGAQSMADRYTYLPSLAPFFAFGLACAWSLQNLERIWTRRTATFVSLSMVSVLLVSLSAGTTAQIGIWKDTFSLWTRVTQVDPTVHLAHINLGIIHLKAGRTEQAISELQTAIRLNTMSADAYNYLGVTYYRSGRIEDAVVHYKRACYIQPDNVQAHFNLGLAYYRLGRAEDAISEYKTALALDAEHAKAHYNLGIAYEAQGRSFEATGEFRTALNINPYFEEARKRLDR